MFKKKKVLIAAGCSYTDPKFFSHDDNLPLSERSGWDMWPKLVADELNLDCLNLAVSGCDNSRMIKKVIMSIFEHGDNVDSVMILLSGWDRSQIFNGISVIPMHNIWEIIYNDNKMPKQAFFKYDNIRKGVIDMIKSDLGFFYNLFHDSKTTTLTMLISLISICEEKNIKFTIMQGVNYYDFNSTNTLIVEYFPKHIPPTKKSYLKYVHSSKVCKELEKRSNNILGWPFDSNMGGWSIDNLRGGGYNTKDDNGGNRFLGMDTLVSNIDFHPNKDAQKVIAEYFIEGYQTSYG